METEAVARVAKLEAGLRKMDNEGGGCPCCHGARDDARRLFLGINIEDEIKAGILETPPIPAAPT